MSQDPRSESGGFHRTGHTTLAPIRPVARRSAGAAGLSASLVLSALAVLSSLGCTGSGSGPAKPATPGQTSFEGEEGANGSGTRSPSQGTLGGSVATAAPGAAAGTTPMGAIGSKDAAAAAPAPMGRTGAVEEADIYRIDHNRLFYLNTYKGFVVYDVADAKNPKRLSQLPVYGYPIEMFVQGNVVYALLRDSLYMSQVSGKVQFERRNVSQLVAIDITDVANPRVLKSVDIVGELREGVSRKIENTIYVVSYIPQSYYWGWRYELTTPTTEQAWVYSFNVADPTNLVLAQKLQIFQGGSVNETDPVTGGQVSRSFSDVAIAATSNALMVVENWYLSTWSPGRSTGNGTGTSGQWTCGSYAGDQRAVVSIIDISDPSGAIRLHTKFETRGSLTDQFKQTYVFDDATKKGTYYGIFARQAWTSTANCSGTQFVQNTMESWDVSDGNAPAKLSSLDFGKPDETVRGSAFDVTRQVAYAVTAQSIDPLYAISFADPTKLTVRSSIDGLSGSVSLFRLVEGNQYLVGIGQDTSQTCTGFQGNEARHSVGMAVSLIDVRNLDAIRLVQRQCVAVDGDWVSSEINWNLDQAHKMIGMQTEGNTTVITIPVSYAKKAQDTGWWWYQTQTAVGIMSYDVTKFDPAKAPADQTVIQNYGTLVHPNGEVRRTIVFTHEDPTTPRRMLINLSDTHISIADIQDLQNPVIQSVVEVAPYVDRVFTYGDYVVESITDMGGASYSASSGLTEFRVRRAGTDPETGEIVSRFSAVGVQNVVPHGEQLIVFRNIQQDVTKAAPSPIAAPVNLTNILVWDLSDPTAPRQIGSVDTSESLYPYYPYFCGFGGGYWFWYGGSSWVGTTDALVFLGYTYDNASRTSGQKLTTVDLANPAAPVVSSAPIPVRTDRSWAGLVTDGADGAGFFLNLWDHVGYRQVGNYQFEKTRHYAQRWHRATAPAAGTVWEAEPAVNLPGTLIRTWMHASGGRAYLTTDVVNSQTTDSTGAPVWRSDTQLNLLRDLTAAGQPGLAELVDTARFSDQSVSDLVVEGNALLVNVNPSYGYFYGGGVVSGGAPTAGSGVAVRTAALTLDDTSDRLEIFDLGGFKLDRVYDQATGTQGVQFMGTHNGQLYMNIVGDGILDVDVTNPSGPVGKQFLRTLGWANTIAFSGDEAYVASGYFGLYRFPRDAASSLPIAAPITAPTGP